MGLVILGADNLASDQADQNPSVVSRPKQAGPVPGKRWIDVFDLEEANRVKVIFHNYFEWPTAEWNAIKSQLSSSSKRIKEADMSSCQMPSIGAEAFRNQVYLTKVELPKNLQFIEDRAFQSASMLELNKLPWTVEEIGEYAFFESGISISVLPKNLKRVASCAFLASDITISLLPKGLELSSRSFERIESGGIEIACDLVDYTGALSAVANVGGPNMKKIWIRSSCETINTGETTWPFSGLMPEDTVIYVEADSKPDGWGEKFNYVGTSNNYYEAEVIYGQKTSPF